MCVHLFGIPAISTRWTYSASPEGLKNSPVEGDLRGQFLIVFVGGPNGSLVRPKDLFQYNVSTCVKQILRLQIQLPNIRKTNLYCSMTHKRSRSSSGSDDYYFFEVLPNTNGISKDIDKHRVIRKNVWFLLVTTLQALLIRPGFVT